MINVLLFIVRIPGLILSAILLVLDYLRLKRYAEHPFICPNCGQQFSVKWYKLFFFRSYTIIMSKKAKLKCPFCGKVDMCKHLYQK